MNSVEAAYESIAKKMLTAFDVPEWHHLELRAKIFNAMVRSEFFVFVGDLVDETKYVKSISDACFYLRDDLLRTTGQRIWGLTFTLYPTGKFNIEYDYNKPEDYEETDEVITGDEINASLGPLTGQDKKPR